MTYKFETRNILIHFQGVEHNIELQVKNVLLVIDSILKSKELAGELIWYPEQLYYPHPDGSGVNIRVWEEMHQGDDWWRIQVPLISNTIF